MAALRARAQEAADRLSEQTDLAGRLEGLLGGASVGRSTSSTTTPARRRRSLARWAEQVITADRYLLMLRVGTRLPLELHHRGLDADEARQPRRRAVE